MLKCEIEAPKNPPSWLIVIKEYCIPAFNSEKAKLFEGNNSSVESLEVLSDGILASGSSDKTIRIWNTTTGLTTKTLIVHLNYVSSLDF